VLVFVFFLHFLFPAGEREKVDRHTKGLRAPTKGLATGNTRSWKDFAFAINRCDQ
jgi:hypothetical protein